MSGIADVLAGRRGWHLEVAHVLDGLAQLPDGCVQTVITSPPYWSLRAYGTEPVTINGWTGELGSEPDPARFVANLVAIMREVRRVLRADGTVWLNIGDSYAGSGKG